LALSGPTEPLTSATKSIDLRWAYLGKAPSSYSPITRAAHQPDEFTTRHHVLSKTPFGLRAPVSAYGHSSNCPRRSPRSP
jgi:hypothetical protein